MQQKYLGTDYDTLGNDSAYRTRNIENCSLPKCRTESFKKLFVSDVRHNKIMEYIKYWSKKLNFYTKI